MSALLKSEIESTTLSTSLHSGHGTELFISGSAPTNCDLHAGNGVEMFISGSAPVATGDVHSGQGA
jgi:hypothetical protein